MKEKIELGRMAFEAKQNNFVTWKEINEYHHVGYHMIQSCIKLYKENLEEKKMEANERVRRELWSKVYSAVLADSTDKNRAIEEADSSIKTYDRRWKKEKVNFEEAVFEVMEDVMKDNEAPCLSGSVIDMILRKINTKVRSLLNEEMDDNK